MTTRTRLRSREERASPLQLAVTSALDDMKAVNVRVLDVRGLTDIADTMVIASGNSDRHVRSIAERVVERAKAAGFLTPVGCHTWRATGVTVYLENGGRLEHAQQMAAHESPRNTKLYDRTKDEITIGEVERIQL